MDRQLLRLLKAGPHSETVLVDHLGGDARYSLLRLWTQGKIKSEASPLNDIRVWRLVRE